MKRILLGCILLWIFTDHALYAEMAFVAYLNDNWDLFIAEDNGRNPVQLTRTPYDERDPCWFPDRRKIAYSASDSAIYIIDLSSRKVKKIAGHDPRRPQVTPHVSPDGKRIIYAQFRPAEEPDDTDLMIFHMDSLESAPLLNQPAIQIWPAWSPDGTRIVYASVHCASACGRVIQELWIANVTGGWSRQLLLTHGYCQQPAWSPDGQTLAFASDHKGNADIYTLNLNNRRLQQQTHTQGRNLKPAWSPDGKKLAFVSNRSGWMSIWIKDIRKGSLERITPFATPKVACKDVAW